MFLLIVQVSIYSRYLVVVRHAVAQLVEALRYKPMVSLELIP